MSVERMGFTLVVFNSHVVAVGGQNSTHALASCETTIDPGIAPWSIFPPLQVARSGPGVAVLDGTIYVAGGMGSHHGSVVYPNDVLDSVEFINSVDNSWTYLVGSRMTSPRCRFGFAVHYGALIAAGGVDAYGEPSETVGNMFADRWWLAVAPVVADSGPGSGWQWPQWWLAVAPVVAGSGPSGGWQWPRWWLPVAPVVAFVPCLNSGTKLRRASEPPPSRSHSCCCVARAYLQVEQLLNGRWVRLPSLLRPLTDVALVSF